MSDIFCGVISCCERNRILLAFYLFSNIFINEEKCKNGNISFQMEEHIGSEKGS